MRLVDPCIATLDACVLAPMPVCDTLLRLAEALFFVPKWSPDILAEVRSTLRKLGRTPGQIDRRIEAMGTAFEDALVDGYEDLIPTLTNHVKDRHVLAAAIVCQAHIIVTDNRKDFPAHSLVNHGIEVQTADEFLVQQYQLSPDRFLQVLEEQAADRGIPLAQLLTNLSVRTPKLAAQLGA